MSLASGGCGKSTRGRSAGPSGARPAPAARPSERAGLRTLRSLVGEAARAELDVGGVFIDLGTFDQHKYTLGGWRNGWGDGEVAEDGTSYAPVEARAVSLRVLTDEPVAEIVLRARSTRGEQAVSVMVDGAPAGQARLGATWSIARVVPGASAALGPGAHELGLVFGAAGRGAATSARADVDWVYLSRSAGAEPPRITPRVAALALGGRARRALEAAPPRAYAFHLQVPRDAFLVFDYGADGPAHFEVRALTDGQPPAVLFRAEAAAGTWREAKIDLAALAGRAVRLELRTTGEAHHAGWGEPELATASPKRDALVDGPVRPARNLILLVMDTARADEFGVWRQGSPVKTPAYDALAAESTVFARAYANENWTKPSVATLLSGLYPSTHGAKREADVLSDEVKLLSERLEEDGFTTAAFIANGFCSDKFGFRRGWGSYRNYIRENRISSADKVFGDAIAWVRDHADGRFFLYLQTIDPHVPYRVPSAYVRPYFPKPYRGFIGAALDGYEQAAISSGKKRARAVDVAWMKALYHAEIAYHDEYLGRFLSALREQGILDDTLVVVTNDHGEELGDHGKYGHGHSLYDELLRSPLIMRYPARFRPGARVDAIVELVDVMPTVLDVLGVGPPGDVDGTSLIPLAGGEAAHRPAYAISEFLDGYRAIHAGRWKLVTSGAGPGKLFDLRSDAGERRDRATDAIVARRLCETYLGEALATPAKARRYQETAGHRRFRPGTVARDPELRRQLRSLGYLGG